MSVWGSPLTIVSASARSFWANVLPAASTTARKTWKPASVGLTRKVTVVVPTGRSTCGVPTSAPSANRRTVAGWATVEVTRAIASISSPRPGRRGRGQAVDEDFGRIALADRPGLDLDPAGRRQRCLVGPAAGRVVAIGQQDDPLLGVVGEERRGQAQRRANVGRRLDRRRSQSVDVANLLGQPLDEGVTAECDDPGDIPLGHLGQGLADEGQARRPTVVADRVRQVDDEDRGQPVDRQDELETGQAEHERRQDRPAHDDRRPTPAGAQAMSRPGMEHEGEGDGQGQEQERQRCREADAHLGRPPRQRQAGGDAASDPAEPVPLVDRPLDAQEDQHDQQEWRPQLVAGRASIGWRGRGRTGTDAGAGARIG